jgi:hypothetical protein
VLGTFSMALQRRRLTRHHHQAQYL